MGELLGVYDRILRDADERTRYHYVLIDFLCRRIAGEPEGAGDAAEARWFTRGEAGQLSLANDTAEVIKFGFEKSCAIGFSALSSPHTLVQIRKRGDHVSKKA